MIDKFDYAEPSCVLCGGKEFYYPEENAQKGSIPIGNMIAKLDSVVMKNDLSEGARILEYWENEGKELRDERGLLTVYSEQMGLYRKTGDETKGLRSVEKGLELINKLGLADTVSGATIMLNAATTMKAFGKAAESISLYEKVKEIYDKYLEKDDLKRAGFYNNAALAYADTKNYEKSEEYYKNALDVLSKSEGNENEIAITYVNLAHLCDLLGREDEVYENMDKALEVIRLQKKEDGNFAAVCDKCAPSFGYFGYFLAEEELKNKAKEIYERA